jgi:hypothetical protein
MQRLVYTAEINEELCDLSGLLEAIDETVRSTTDCFIERSKLESPDEVCENGEWEEEEDEQ